MATAKPTENSASSRQLGSQGMIAVVVGGGLLPLDVVRALKARGEEPLLVMVEGEAEPNAEFDACPQLNLKLENVGSLLGLLRAKGVGRLVLAGSISRRPRLSRMKWTPGLLRLVPAALSALGAGGDDALLRAVIGHVERIGIRVIGAHEIVPDLLATAGSMTKAKPDRTAMRDIRAGAAAARALGQLDIGQAAVAIGGRVVTLEDVAGTQALLRRMPDLRRNGRLAGRAGGVLVKLAKPGQELRADLPTIGPDTITDAHAAGLCGIALDAGRAFILDCARTIETADRLGLFIHGISGACDDERD